MSRTTTAIIAAIASLALVPGVADARGHHKHHRHHSHKVRVKVLHTAASATDQYADPTGPATGLVTVVSFAGGKLTLQQADGTTSGRVTARTDISCEATAPASTRSRGDDGESGDDDAGHGATTTAPLSTGDVPSASHDQGDDDAGENDRESGDDEGQDGSDRSSSCDQSALVPGAVVRRAKLEIAGGTATFDAIELVRPAA